MRKLSGARLRFALTRATQLAPEGASRASCVVFLDIGRGPEFAERVWPAPIDDTFSGGCAHAFSQRGIRSERTDSPHEIIHIAGSSDETVRSVLYQFLGAAGIGNNYRHAASLRFQNDVAECVGGAREHKNIRRSVGGRQFFSPEITGKNRPRQRLRKLLGIGALT